MTETWSPTEAAARGAAWLDDEEPEWFGAIDTDRLYLGDCFACVFGQMFRQLCGSYNPYEFAVERFGFVESDAVMFGFDIPNPNHAPGAEKPNHLRYTHLTAAWRTEIETRRHAQQRAENAGGERDGESG